jgi:hypothetical protein
MGRHSETPNHRTIVAGCLTATLLFPFSMALFMGLALAIGPMNCAHPNQCSSHEENAKGLLSIIVLFGGGLGLPIAAGILVNKATQNR